MGNNIRTEVQDNLLEQIPSNPHGILLLAPRIGKGRIAIGLIKRENYQSIKWISLSRKLIEENVPKEFKTWDAEEYLPRVTFNTYKSLHKEEGECDLLILDEYQSLTEANSAPLFTGQLRPKRIICLSGTEPKDEEKLELYKRLGLNIIVKVGIDEAVDLKLIANYKINVLEVDLNNIDKDFQGGSKAKGYFPQTESQAYAWINKQANMAMYQRRSDVNVQIMKRLHFIKQSPSKEKAAEFLLSKLDGRVLVFCSGIDQAERIYPESNYHSKSRNRKALDDFIQGDTDRLALVNAGGVGETYSDVNHFVLVQADSDNTGLTTQKIARSLLEQGDDYVASIWVIKLIGTQDDKWVSSFLEGFDQSKITYQRFINFKNHHNGS
jgi:hypothetical protein